MEVFDIFLLEAVLNGILLGGLLALLSLGLNLIFGVIDVVWICYAEMIMIGMYAVWLLHAKYAWPLLLAMAAGVAVVALLGALLHHFVIRPVLAAEPINQLLVTGGVLFFLQAAATLAFGIEFRNLGVKMTPLALGEMSFSMPRLIAFAVAVAGVAGTWLFLSRTYIGTAIRAISQDRADHAADGRGREPHLHRHLGAGRRRSRVWAPACWCCSTTSIRRSACRSARSPSSSACSGGLGNMLGRLHRRVHLRAVHLGGRFLLRHRVGLRDRVPLLHRGDVLAPAGHPGGKVK